MSGKHSQQIRGLDAAGRRIGNAKGTFGARFGRMFPDLPAAKYGVTKAEEDANLIVLAAKMISPLDLPKDEPDDEESGIPALYTYFAQFVDHDITFDPASSLQKVRDPDATEDFRTPAFDLDNVYGRGPGDQPYMYASDGKSLLLGDPITNGDPHARDLQRNSAGRALIGDPRNDENAIVSQLQGLFIRFHNHFVREHPSMGIDQVQELVRDHYQYIVINDFLPRIVSKAVLNELGPGGRYERSKLKFFTQFDNPFMPIEFSTAAYRLGHSMIRPGYRLNDAILLPIFPIPPEQHTGFSEGMTGFRRLISNWAIDWARFIDIEVRDYGTQTPATTPPDKAAADALANFRRLQFAYRIDTALVDPLGTLPPAIASNPASLALRNLERGRQFSLPSGQAIATAMGVTPLADKDILIGQGVDNPDKPLKGIVEATGKAVFGGNCPLWTYILAEAMHNKQTPPPKVPAKGGGPVSTPQLGPVGGRIVAEVFLGLLFADKKSYLTRNPNWVPPSGKEFGLKQFVEMALLHG